MGDTVPSSGLISTSDAQIAHLRQENGKRSVLVTKVVQASGRSVAAMSAPNHQVIRLFQKNASGGYLKTRRPYLPTLAFTSISHLILSLADLQDVIFQTTSSIRKSKGAGKVKPTLLRVVRNSGWRVRIAVSP